MSSRAAQELITSLSPDVIVVACFPRMIPPAIRKIPRLGTINIHPSLLPAHRGPDPLFWTFRHGEGRAGVTIHEVTGRLDAGPILAQRTIPYADGITEAELELDLARIGAHLALGAIDDLVAGTATRMPQDERHATYESWPGEDDYIIDTHRPARAAYNFIRGVQERGIPVRIQTDHEVVAVDTALRYSDHKPPQAQVASQEIAIQFDAGWLVVRSLTRDQD